ncbi:hypothetical protein DICVIV_03503 [Dictyocaulus viviparus]|uniref:SXP/RAL-2 family protein Ani s 5-like cation-binding domain-containing protein n=1 Tax=Dictyocaulus viviparus TaxID=29172 RepID=A0A0D8Y0U6_DICVI|nr:hypothetical protein DICVIV_03503 [Dictyocaulus viviparus]
MRYMALFYAVFVPSICDPPLFFEELLNLLDKENPVVNKLIDLKDNLTMIRDAKKDKIAEIVKRLPSDIQNKYKAAVNEEKRKAKEKYEANLDVTMKYGLHDLLIETEALKMNLAISDQEADEFKKKAALENNVSIEKTEL